MPGAQGQSWFTNFLRQDNSYQDPIVNNLNSNNPSWPYSSILAAWLGASGNRGQIPGTQTNDNASPGNVGEYISSTVILANALSLANLTNTNLQTISLTPGDWDVSATGAFTHDTNGSATGGVNLVYAGITSVSGGAFINVKTDSTDHFGELGPINFGLTNVPTVKAGPSRFSLAVTTTIYMVVFTSGTPCFASGLLRARRVR